MSRSRYVSYYNRPAPPLRHAKPLYGEHEDAGRFVRCRHCGQINDTEKRTSISPDAPYALPVLADNLSLWLECEGTNGSSTITDSGPTNHTITALSGAVLTTSRARFGSSCLDLTASGSWIRLADHANFDFSGGSFCVAAWFFYSSLSSVGTIYNQTTGTDYVWLSLRTTSGRSYASFLLRESGVDVITLEGGTDQLRPNNWNHIEIDENDNDYYLFLNGQRVAYASSAYRPANYTGVVQIGATVGINKFTGYLDDYLVSKTYRHTEDFWPDRIDYFTPRVGGSGCLFCGSPNYDQ